MNNRLIIEGRKTFNLKGITFKKVISGVSRYKDAILARRDEKQAFSEKYVSVKDNVGKLMSEQEYLAAVQELGTLSNYNSIVEEISNNQGSVSTSNNETIDSAEQERLLSPSTETVLSIDELDKKFVSERKQVSDKISTLSKGMESSFEEIKKEVNDSLDSISSEVVASFDEKIDASDSEFIGETVKNEVPVVEEKPKFDFSKFIAKPPVVGETKKSDAEDISSYSLDAAEGSPKTETKDEVGSDVTLDSIIEKLKVTSFFDDISSETTLEEKPKDKIEINPIVLDSVVDSLDVSAFFDDVSVGKTDDLIPNEIASTSSEVADSFESIKKDVADSLDLISKKAEEGLADVKTDSSVSDTVVEKPIVQASSEEKIVSQEVPVVDSKPDYEWLKDTYDVIKRQATEIEEKDAEIAYLKGVIAKLRVVGKDSFGQEVSEKKI